MKLKALALAAKMCCQASAWQWQARQHKAARDQKPGL